MNWFISKFAWLFVVYGLYFINNWDAYHLFFKWWGGVFEIESDSISDRKFRYHFFNPKKWIHFSGQQQIKSKSLHQNIFPGQLNCKKPKNCIKCELFFLVLPRFKIYKLNLMQKSFTAMTVPEKMSFVWVHFFLGCIRLLKWGDKIKIYEHYLLPPLSWHFHIFFSILDQINFKKIKK